MKIHQNFDDVCLERVLLDKLNCWRTLKATEMGWGINAKPFVCIS